MANTNNTSPRQIHVSPGIYFSESDLGVAAKSLGITSLGLVGETVKGPAFQPIAVPDWETYQRYFGGTNTAHFRGSRYPKYEAPYIAKEYLKQSNHLQVVRVLGLSGVNAGPAWIITAYGTTSELYTQAEPMIVAVLRSRGEHKDAAFIREATEADKKKGICDTVYEYDKILYYAKEVKLAASKSLTLNDDCTPSYNSETQSFTSNVNNLGTFTIVVTDYLGQTHNYSVSLNPGERNYILNVFGTDPENGDSEIFVEELYDIALRQLVELGEIDSISNTMETINEVVVTPKFAPVTDILTKDESMLTRRNVGERYLFTQDSLNSNDNSKLKVHTRASKGGVWAATEGQVGHIYTVVAYTNPNGTRQYYYGETTDSIETLSTERKFTDVTGAEGTDNEYKFFNNAVECLTDNMFYVMTADNAVKPITVDWHNYKEPYRYASTPWIVSEMKGSAEHVELHKLFRFHTISDGNASNTEVKVSIENIDPDQGTFDVIVRAFGDTDNSVQSVESFRQCSLVPGSTNYIALLIGSTDGDYSSKSQYITVEVNEGDQTRVSIPAGFLGYPIRNMSGTTVSKNGTPKKLATPYFKYNTSVDEDVRINRQYFGVSNITGIDEDFLRYKGVEAYNDEPAGLTPCFHLDARILNTTEENEGLTQTVSVDGVTGYQWVTVGKENTTFMGIEPRIGNAETMAGTIYEDKRYRKFTVAFYGGWDGWDYYRTSRSTQDKFKFEKYRGQINTISGIGASFNMLRQPELYGFDKAAKCLNSDWYAYLSAIRQFANPRQTDINVLATPGIDYVNDQLLVEEVIDMVHNERADAVYVVTTPDKPYGAGNSVTEMYSANDAAMNLEDTGIDDNYTTSYFPWVKYYDESNNQYIFLPPTKDVVRNFAYTDNVAYPWFAAAGWNRGEVNAEDVRIKLKVEQTDELYGGRLNYINCFAEDGMRLWGDKNFQIADTPLNRISKRRLFIRIRKLLSIACRGIVFDPNDNGSVKTMDDACRQVLNDIVKNRGIVDYRLKIDDSEEARARLAIPARILIKPMPNVEFIEINLVMTPYGANFDDI